MTKTCPLCQAEKPVSEFYTHPKSKDGFQDYCNLCKSDLAKRRYREDKDEIMYKVISWQFDNFEKVRAYKRKYKLKEKQLRHEKNNGKTEQRKRGRPPRVKKELQEGSEGE